jgi:hypothetical protein
MGMWIYSITEVEMEDTTAEDDKEEEIKEGDDEKEEDSQDGDEVRPCRVF